MEIGIQIQESPSNDRFLIKEGTSTPPPTLLPANSEAI